MARAALNGARIPMMELLVRRGADVNAAWNGSWPIVFAPCETVDPESLEWLLKHGAKPDTPYGSALDYVIGSYVRTPRLARCIEILQAFGASTKYQEPAVMSILLGRLDAGDDPSIIHRRFSGLDFGTTGGRMLTLEGATLLHVAAEYLKLEAARVLLSLGSEVNARALVHADGVGGQTPLFHAMSQAGRLGGPMTELLVAHGADPGMRARVPGYYEHPGEILECSASEYAGLLR